MNKNLDKHSLKWLRIYGYCLNSGDEKFTKLKEHLKEHYTYEYYFYVDEDIKKEAEKIFKNDDYTTREFIKSFGRRFRAEKKRLIKEIYGLEKKGIRWFKDALEGKKGCIFFI